MAADILAIPIFIVASESTFSAGRVIDSYRANLAPKTVQALICGGDWMLKSHGIKKRDKLAFKFVLCKKYYDFQFANHALILCNAG